MSCKILDNLVNRRAGVSPEMAVRLATAFGGSAQARINRQSAYDLAQVRKREADIRATVTPQLMLKQARPAPPRHSNDYSIANARSCHNDPCRSHLGFPMPSHPKPVKAPGPPPWLQDFDDEAREFLFQTAWPFLKSIDYATPVLSIFVAFIGAFAGGIAGWFISRRYNQRDYNERQILVANACKSIIFSIIESLLALKEQNVGCIIERYRFDRSRFLIHRRLFNYKLIERWLGSSGQISARDKWSLCRLPLGAVFGASRREGVARPE